MYRLLIFILILLFCLIVADIVVHQINLNKLRDKFPKEIISEIENDIELPIIEGDRHKIPHIVHRTYISLEKAEKFKEASKITLEKNPFLTEHFYDDEEVERFIKTHYSQRVVDAYNSINKKYGPAKADFFRYLVMYVKGGLYLDVKSYAYENLFDLFKEEDKLIISKGRNYSLNINSFGIIPTMKNSYDWSTFSGIKYGEYNNWHFMAPPGHPIIGKLIQHIVLNIEQKKDSYKYGEYSVLVLTGPIIFTQVIEKYRNEDNLKLMEPGYGGRVSYAIVNHKSGNKNHYSKLEDKNVLV